MWAPDMENSYPFSTWQREVLMWSIANSDIEPHRQAAMLIMQLRGGARDLTRELPVNVIMNGAPLNGNQVDGMTYVMNLLAERYGQLGEELRLKVIKEFMDFDRKHHENIDELLTRFEIVRSRANDLGNFNMSYEGISYMLLRACKVNDQQFIMLTQPTQGRLPNNEPEYRGLFSALRRLGHVVEHHHDNIASGLRHKGRGRGDHYHATTEQSTEGTMNTTSYPQWNVGNDWYPSEGHNVYDWNSGSSSQGPITDSLGWNLSEWPEQSYTANETIDSGTDTDTVSSYGDTWYDYDDITEDVDDGQKAGVVLVVPTC